MYDAVVFDFDGVIVEPPSNDALCAAASDALEGVNLDANPRAVAGDILRGDVDALAERCRNGSVEVTALCQRAASASFEAQRREVEAGLRSVYEDVRALSELDRPLGVVTDNQPQVVQYLLRVFDLDGLFETVRCRTIAPRNLRRRKPDTRNLEAALSDLGTDDAVHVGDRAVDVEVARRLGLDSVLVARPDHEPTPDVSPEYVVAGLDELPAIVSGTEG